MVLEVVSGSDFPDFCYEMEQTWRRMGSQTDAKTTSGRKNGFSLPSVKIKSFRTHKQPESMNKRRFRPISLFIDFLLISVRFETVCPLRPQRLIFEILFRRRKKGLEIPIGARDFWLPGPGPSGIFAQTLGPPAARRRTRNSGIRVAQTPRRTLSRAKEFLRKSRFCIFR